MRRHTLDALLAAQRERASGDLGEPGAEEFQHLQIERNRVS